MNVLQHTRNELNLCPKENRPDRSYRDTLLIAVFDGHLSKRYHRIREGIPPLGIATSSDGQFLIADYYSLKVFDSNGNFYMSVRPQSKTTSYIYDLARAISDVDNTIYLLVTQLMSPRISSPEKFEVQVFNETLDFPLRFSVGKGSGFNRMTVSGSKVFILKEHKVVDLYHARNGSYVGSFCEGIIESAQEIAASKDGRVMVLDLDQSCQLFNVDGLHLANFSVNI